MTMYERSELESYLNDFQREWKEKIGETGYDLSSSLLRLVDLILTDQDENLKEMRKELYERTTELIDERVKEAVAEQMNELVPSWALRGNAETIPVSKLDKEGILRVLFAPGFITDGEQFELARALLEDLTERGVMGDR